jgi:DNA-binding transcriptional LysR family regulator
MANQRRVDEPAPGPKALTVARIEAFLAVVRGGGLAGAAGRGNLQQQTRLSRRMNELEAVIGADLFQREGKRRLWTRLTHDGERLQRVALELEDLRVNAASRRGGAPGVTSLPLVRLHANDSVLRWLLLPTLATHDARRSGFRVDVTASTTILDDVRKGRCELGIGTPGSGRPEGLSSAPLRPWAYAAFLPVPTRRPGAKDLRRWAFVDVSTRPDKLDALDRRAGPLARSGLSCETFALAARIVAAGRFAAVLPIAARAELKGLAVPVPEALPEDARTDDLHLFVRTDALSRRRTTRDCFEHLARALGGGPAARSGP